MFAFHVKNTPVHSKVCSWDQWEERFRSLLAAVVRNQLRSAAVGLPEGIFLNEVDSGGSFSHSIVDIDSRAPLLLLPPRESAILPFETLGAAVTQRKNNADLESLIIILLNRARSGEPMAATRSCTLALGSTCPSELNTIFAI